MEHIADKRHSMAIEFFLIKELGLERSMRGQERLKDAYMVLLHCERDVPRGAAQIHEQYMERLKQSFGKVAHSMLQQGRIDKVLFERVRRTLLIAFNSEAILRVYLRLKDR